MIPAAEKTLKLAIFASGRGSNFLNIVKRYEEGALPGLEPAVLICDKECPAADSAREKSFDTHVVKPSGYPDKAAYEKEILRILQKSGAELIALAGYMRLVGPTLLQAFPGRILNLHPSLLPLYPGKHAIERAFQDRVSETGASVHLVDAGLDSGPILRQKTVPVKPEMSLDELEEKIHAAEHELYPQVLIEYAASLRKE